MAAPGSKDEDILAWAVRESRILITFDKDFGELAWRANLPATSGIILFSHPNAASGSGRSKTRPKDSRARGWEGKFSVIEQRIRMRDLPK